MLSDLGDIAGISLLVRSYPAEVVDAAIASCGRTEQRRRLLSARLMVYFVLAMALFSPAPYLDVMHRLTAGLRWGGLWDGERIPSKASIFQARERLGSGPLEALFRAVVRPLATLDSPDAHWRGRRLLLLREQQVELPDGAGHPPRLLFSGLLETGTGAVLDATWAEGESTRTLLRSTGPDTLLVLDQVPTDPALLADAAARDAPLLWRLRPARVPFQVQQRLPDGSFLTRLHGRTVRVIAPDAVTTLLNPAEAPAAELLDTLTRGAGGGEALLSALFGTTHDTGPLTSRTADGIHQEVYGRLLVHFAMRQSLQYARSAGEPQGSLPMPELA